jgi:hypothetical protein
MLSVLPLNWQMTALFFITLLPVCFVMKLAAFWGVAPAKRDWKWIVSPFPSAAALQQALPRSAGPRLLGRALVALVGCVAGYWLCRQWFDRIPVVFWSYAGAVVLWLVTEALGTLVVFLGWPSGRLLPLPHGAVPPLAHGLSEFWGRRWNQWMSQCFHQLIFHPLRRRPVLALFAVFVASGLLHEWVINFPLYLDGEEPFRLHAALLHVASHRHFIGATLAPRCRACVVGVALRFWRRAPHRERRAVENSASLAGVTGVGRRCCAARIVGKAAALPYQHRRDRFHLVPD